MAKRSRRRSRNGRSSPLGSVEICETRNLLSAVLPAYADGEFTFGDAAQDAPYGLDNTFLLESNPGASKTIFLDFDGHHSVDNVWGHDIVFPAFNRTGSADTFADSELIEIQKQFQNVAEDFLPFDVNVTTIDPGVEALRKSGANDTEWGIRTLNTQATDGFGNGIGGVAYLNSFSWSSDTPVFTFNKGARNGGMTNSHEIGHALGLQHDGLGTRTYHPGAGSGDTGWGPILGAPFGKRVTQWSNGDYADSTSTQDDLNIIANTRNGFGFRGDDHGDDLTSSTGLTVVDDVQLSGWGVVGGTNDQDWFSFQAGEGTVDLSIDAFGQDPNLDILATVYDAAGNVVASSNPIDSTNASLTIDVPAGNYFLSVDGVGRDGRYSDYGSLGFFAVNGTRVQPEAIVGEAGRVDQIDHNWQTIQLDNSYDNPAVVFGPVSYNGGHETAVRVRNVTSTSFDVRLQEWMYLDQWHTLESVGYVVVESGIHTLADGTVIAAGANPAVDHNWEDIDFGYEFDAAPVVLSQATTFAGGDTIVTRQRNVSSTGFSVRLQEEEARGWHIDEQVAWIAIDAAVGVSGDSTFESLLTGDTVTHRDSAVEFTAEFNASPVVVAAMQTTDGGDTANLRQKNLTADGFTVWVDEEKSRDNEIGHTTEVVGVFAIEAGNIVANSAGQAAGSSGGGSEGGFGDGDSGGDGTGSIVPLTTYSETDGTLGEGEFLASGHMGHEDGCDHDHDEELDHHDHHHESDVHGEGHDDGCQCEQCQGGGSSLEDVVVDNNVLPEQEDNSLFEVFSELSDAKEIVLLNADSDVAAPSVQTDSRSWLELLHG